MIVGPCESVMPKTLRASPNSTTHDALLYLNRYNNGYVGVCKYTHLHIRLFTHEAFISKNHNFLIHEDEILIIFIQIDDYFKINQFLLIIEFKRNFKHAVNRFNFKFITRYIQYLILKEHIVFHIFYNINDASFGLGLFTRANTNTSIYPHTQMYVYVKGIIP